MRKLIFTLLSLISLSTNVFAQERVGIGSKAGLNISTLNEANIENTKILTGFHIGGIVEI